MANTAITDLEGLMTIVTNDSVLTKAQKAHCQSLLFQLAKILFGPSSASTVIGNGANG
jgi:hypothetical protein